MDGWSVLAVAASSWDRSQVDPDNVAGVDTADGEETVAGEDIVVVGVDIVAVQDVVDMAVQTFQQDQVV